MGPYYDTAQSILHDRTPDAVRLLERRQDALDEPPGGNARILFGAVMFVLAVLAYSLDAADQGNAEEGAVQVAHHSSRP